MVSNVFNNPHFDVSKFQVWDSYLNEDGSDSEVNTFRIPAKPNVGTRIIGAYSSAKGETTQALSKGASAEGHSAIAAGSYSHAEGVGTYAAYGSHAEGVQTEALGQCVHTEGQNTKATYWASHAEGTATQALNNSAHSEGNTTVASGNSSHAEGKLTEASGDYSHAEGESTKATAKTSHAEGTSTQANGIDSHSEGYLAKAEGNGSHAEGYNTKAEGDYSHTEGADTVAQGWASHASGSGTVAVKTSQTAVGQYNNYKSYEAWTNDKSAIPYFTVGNGTSNTDRSNAFQVFADGHAELQTVGSSRNSVATTGYVDDKLTGVDSGSTEVKVNNTDAFKILSINHRGYNTVAPENTLQAYKLSKANGFDFVECDIRLTSDGVPVLLHDATINRTARNSDGSTIAETINISDITYEQALTYDFGIWKGSEYAGTKIPTLEEFLQLCQALSLHPYLNTYGDNFSAETVCDIIKSHSMESNVTFVSDVYDGLVDLANIIPEARYGFIAYTTNPSADMTTSMERICDIASYIFVDADISRIDAPTYISMCKGWGNIGLEVYTLNTESQILALDPFITGVTSDSLVASKILYAANCDESDITNESNAGIKTDDGGEIFNDYANNTAKSLAHAEGSNTTASGWTAHAEGYNTQATGSNSHAEGSSTVASKSSTHAEGYKSQATGEGAHAEGYDTRATGGYSHSEGQETTASGWVAHAEGQSTVASHGGSHAAGYYTKTGRTNQTVVGQFNEGKSDTYFEVGNGTSNTDRKNAFEVFADGHAELQTVGATDASIVTRSYVSNEITNVKTQIKSSQYRKIELNTANSVEINHSLSNCEKLALYLSLMPADNSLTTNLTITINTAYGGPWIGTFECSSESSLFYANIEYCKQLDAYFVKYILDNSGNGKSGVHSIQSFFGNMQVSFSIPVSGTIYIEESGSIY